MDDNTDEIESALGFKPQKTVFYNKCLPYAEDLNDEIKNSISKIRFNLSKAVVQRDIRSGFLYWSYQLRRYITLYGYCFSKDDHLFFIKVLFEIATNQLQEYCVCAKCYELLFLLLKKKELLSPHELVIPWRPLYDYYKNVIELSHRNPGSYFLTSSLDSSFRLATGLLRLYFPISATREMLELFRPMLHPEDTTINKVFTTIDMFLPTSYASDEQPPPYKLWLDEFLDLWTNSDCDLTWQSNLLYLFARLSWDNIGEISWNKYLSLIFNQIIRHFSLPVTYKNSQRPGSPHLDTSSITSFIVSNIHEAEMKVYTKDLLMIICSYFHPSNFGAWSRHLHRFLVQLTGYFFKRVYNERYKPSSWERTVPDAKKLTEDDITFLIEAILPLAKLSTFSKIGCYEAGTIYQKLALLRPQLVLPELLTQLEAALDTLIEPHRLFASVHCTLKVARPIVLGGQLDIASTKQYPEGQAWVIPLLFQSLPGIDANDFQKCMVTFQFIATFSFLIPIENYSLAAETDTELSEIEKSVCLQSAGFQEFVLQFLEKCFELIMSCSIEYGHHHDKDTNVMNMEENMFEVGLSSAFKAILNESSPEIFDVAIERLWGFTKGRCMEIKVSGRLLSVLCRAAARANTEKTLNLFLPPICKLLLALTDSDFVRDQENADNEVLFNLLILSELVEGDGKHVNKHVSLLSRVLENTLHMKCMKAQKMASSILQCLLHSLSATSVTDFGLVSKESTNDNICPIKIWGKSIPTEDLNISWLEPDEEQRSSIEMLLVKFMVPELEIMRKVTNGDTSYTRERFHQGLIIIQDSLWAGGFLPLWDEEICPLINMTTEMNSTQLIVGTKKLEVHLSSSNFPKNVRLAVANTIIELVESMLEKGSDDTKALMYALNIYYNLAFFFGIRKEDHDSMTKSVYMMKQSLRLMEKGQNLRPVLISRAKIQHEKRVIVKNERIFTNTHKRIIMSLWKMSISHYSEVRRKSQTILGKFLREFRMSYKIIIPDIIEILKKDPVENHKAFKGTLFVLHNSKCSPLYVKKDWDVLLQLWPALVSAKYSEKASIIKLYDTINHFLRRHLETFAIQCPGNDKAEETAKNYLRSLNADGWELTDDRQHAFEEISKSNLETYQKLVNKLADVINNGSLHFRRVQLCLSMLRMIIRQDSPFPSSGVQAVVNNLISHNIDLRKIAMYAMPQILNSQKRKHKRILINTQEDVSKQFPSVTAQGGLDSSWMQFNRSSIDMTKERWENGIFFHKAHHGWYCLPSKIDVYAPYSQQPRVNRDPSELSAEELVLFNFFKDESNVDGLIDYLAIEEDKDYDKFEMHNSVLFERLFRNFGDVFLPNFLKHLTKLAESTTESHQRCAAEMLSGMVRGIKHWPYEISMNMLDIAQKTLKIVFSKVMNETLQDWGVCISNIGRDRDPNKLAKLIELVLEKPLIREERGSFLVSSQLFLCGRLLEQLQWRVASCSHDILDDLKLQLCNPYKSIRDRIGLFLFKLFKREHATMGDATNTVYPSQPDFIDHVLPQLSILIQGSGTRHSSAVSFYASNEDSQSEVPLSTKIQDQLTLSDNFIKVASHCDRSIESIIQKADSNISSQLSISKLSPDLKLADVDMLNHESLVSNSGCGFLPGESEERKNAFRLMNTMCKYLMWISSHGNYSPDIFKFLPYLCHLEETDSDQELRFNCHSSLVYLTRFIMPSSKDCCVVIGILKDIIMNRANWWRARCSGLRFLQVVVFNNYFWIACEQNECEDLRSLIWEITFESIKDHRAEIRNAAAELLSGCYHYRLFKNTQETLKIFKTMLDGTKMSKKKKELSKSSENIITRHAAILGLCAYVNAHPYDVIDDIPEILIILTLCVHDPQPLSTDAKQALSDFKRTHHDNWKEHQKMFSSEQLAALNEVLVSPSYYS